MNSYKQLRVLFDGSEVGHLAVTPNHLVAFAYSENWLKNGFSISPYSLPLHSGVMIPRKYDPFDGLFGVFADSLPDGWGRLLVDRLLLKHGINPLTVNPLSRLAIVGSSGMGALEYQPESPIQVEPIEMSIDQIAVACQKMFGTETSESLDTLYQMGGSSGGARPKVYYSLNGEEWIVKFPSSSDPENIGRQEYEYGLCAQKCGIEMAEIKLLPSAINDGYFATKRFDRMEKKRVHMISASGLLETTHRIPNLDYHILMQLTLQLTKNYAELEKLFRLMCFNVFSHNRDDHSKNFSYLYQNGQWVLSPAYDLTYSNSIGGEHATTVNGNGKDPGMDDLLAVAQKAKLDTKRMKQIAQEIQETVHQCLKHYIGKKANG